MTTRELMLSDLRLDTGTQVRLTINHVVVRDYAELMRDGVVFPPITVFYDGCDHHLADGFHRYHAAQQIGRTTLVADVHGGALDAALWFALGANRTNGCQLTRYDKQHAVMIALKTWPNKLQRVIAAHVGCTQSLVSKVMTKVLTTGDSRDRICQRAVAFQKKREDIRALLQAGVSGETIKQQLHVHGTTIAKVRRELAATSPLTAGVKPATRGSRAAIEARRAEMRRMAAEGYRSSQIAAAVGLTEDTCRDTLRRAGITVPGDMTTRYTRHPEANRIVSRIVEDAENLLTGLNLIAFGDLDRTQVTDWVRSLHQSRAALGAFIKRLSQELSDGEAA